MWETIEQTLSVSSARLRVPGGWIVRTIVTDAQSGVQVTLINVDDPTHTWEANSAWLPIDEAPVHVQHAAKVITMEPGRGRARLYYGSNNKLFCLWNGGDVGSPATLWYQLPDMARSSE